jgi:hypothetical protein
MAAATAAKPTAYPAKPMLGKPAAEPVFPPEAPPVAVGDTEEL